MTIEELAAQVAKEIRANLGGFSIDRIEEKYPSLSVSFSWKEPFRVEVSLELTGQDDDETIKNEIRRQLFPYATRFLVQGPTNNNLKQGSHHSATRGRMFDSSASLQLS